MMVRFWQRLRDTLSLARLASRVAGGRFIWIGPLLTLIWPLFLIGRLWLGFGERAMEPVAAQAVMTTPLVLLAIALGGRVIAGEIDRRTLEIAYTVPGGAQRIWTAKLLAALFWLFVAELLLIPPIWIFLTEVPFSAIYGTFQAATVYLMLATGFASLTKSETTGALCTVAALFLNLLFTGFGDQQQRWSPLWNPLRLTQADPTDVFTWTVQNRVFMVLVVVALVALAYARAERRETMLAG